jgi:hypothetical protein
MPARPTTPPPDRFGDEDDDLAPPTSPLPIPPEELEDEEEDDEDEPRHWDPNSPTANYRRGIERRRGPWRLTVGILVLLVVVAAGIYVATTPRPTGSSSGGGSGCTSGCTSPPTDYVQFGSPIVSSLTCGEGGSVSVEEVSWLGATTPLTTADVFLEVTEIVDGDIVGASSSAPFVTRASLCPGMPPSPSYSWYVVLQDSGGANLMSFSYANGWAYIGPGPSSLPLSNGTELFLVVTPSLAGIGYALDAGGTEGGPVVSGSVDL